MEGLVALIFIPVVGASVFIGGLLISSVVGATNSKIGPYTSRWMFWRNATVKRINRELGLDFPLNGGQETKTTVGPLMLTLRPREVIIELSDSEERFPDITLSSPAPEKLVTTLSRLGQKLVHRYDSHETGFSNLEKNYQLDGTSPKMLPLIDGPMLRTLAHFRKLNLDPFIYRFGGWLSPYLVQEALTFSQTMIQADVRQKTLEGLDQPNSCLRRTYLELLLRHHPIDEQIRQKARELLEDPFESVALVAAEILGAEALPFLTGLLEDIRVDTSTIVATLATIDDPSMSDLVFNLLSGPLANQLLVEEIIPLITKYPDPRFVELLCRKAEQIKSGFSREILFQALAVIGSEETNDFLVSQLDTDNPSQSLVQALGVLGNVTAVPPLHRCLKASPEGPLARQLQDSILSIQMRLGDVEQGWLSLGGKGEHGGLSLMTDGQVGALTLSDKSESS